MIYRLLLSIIIFTSFQAYAIKEPKSMAVDKRLGVIVYNPYDVHRFTGYYGYQSSIIFAEDESIDTISMGDSIPWQMVPQGNRLFLKPIEQDATTNMTLITNKRVYYFELHAEEAIDINENGLMFAVKFLYPGDPDSSSPISTANAGPDLTNKSLFNFNYTISGPEIVSPIKIFDDGKFTYFEFKDSESELPAIFYVNSRGSEGLINYRMAGKYLAIESVRERFTLRHGKDIVCVFNETLISKREKADKKESKKKNPNANFNSGSK